MQNEFGKLIRQKRLEKNMTLRQLNKLIGLSRAFLHIVESGNDYKDSNYKTSYPKPEVILKLAKALDISSDVLFTLAGLIPSDVAEIIKTKNPTKMYEIIRNINQIN